MRPAIGPVDDQIVTVAEFVDESPPDQPTGDVCASLRLMDHLHRARPFQARGPQSALHRSNDVALLAQAPKRRLEVLLKAPQSAAHVLGKSERTELAQSPGTKRAIGQVAASGMDGSRQACLVQQAAIDRSQPFGMNITAQP
jgi:hypothetical protein